MLVFSFVLCLFFFMYYAFSFDIFIGVCFQLVFSLVLCLLLVFFLVICFSPLIFSLDYVFFWYFLFCYSKLFLFCYFFPSLNYVFCWYFLLCYADPATDLCHSWNFLPASRLLPQLLTAFFSGNLGKYGTQQKMYNALGIIIFMWTIFPRSFPIALSIYFCVLPLFSFRLPCKERALCIFPEILSKKGVTDGLSHAFVM